MTQTFTLPVVGAWHRKPAPWVLRTLPTHAPLFLRADPHNPVDPNAIGVWIDLEIQDDGIKNTLRQSYPELTDVFEFQLGFIPAVAALSLQTQGWTDSDVPGTFLVSADGKPKIRFHFAPTGEI